jgi:hypothetical protein
VGISHSIKIPVSYFQETQLLQQKVCTFYSYSIPSIQWQKLVEYVMSVNGQRQRQQKYVSEGIFSHFQAQQLNLIQLSILHQ